MDSHPSEELPAPPPPRRPLVSSAVVASETHSSLKRPAEALLEEHVDVKQRNKRLYAGLLGTLQRFSREEAQIQNTTAAQRRAQVERRAAEKAEEGSRRLRQQAHDEMRRNREGEIARKRELNAQSACQRLAALYAKRLARADKLSSRLLLSTTTPQLYWCAAKSCAEVERLRKEAAGHSSWKAAVLEALAAEQAVLMEKLTQQPGRGPKGQEVNAAMDTKGDGAAVDTNDGGALPAERGDEELQQEEDVEMAGTGNLAGIDIHDQT